MFNTAIEIPIVPYLEGEEDDFDDDEGLNEHFYLWRFSEITSYGKCQYKDCKNGTMFTSGSAEFFTYLPVKTIESLISQAKFLDMRDSMLMFHQN